MTERKKRITRDWAATIIGIGAAVATALATGFSFDTFNFRSPDQWTKLFAIVLPAVLGALSTLKGKKPE